jgi:complex iron-sulfur molybdoenzyme family reductase subunit gamma
VTDRRRLAVATLLVACLVVSATVLAPMVAARPANQIPVSDVRGEDAPARPTGDAWATVPAVEVPLASAPSGLPNAGDTSAESLRVQAARTDERFFLRLSWADPTADRNVTGPRGFVDAAAVQLPVNESVRPPIAMGSLDNPVNVWYWRGDGSAEELLAGGTGTTTAVGAGRVDATTAYEDGRWTVVVSRPTTVDAADRTTLAVDRDVDVAFAVWNGSHGERAGRKAVSEWYHLALGPGPQGPPYESLLWAVAGLAIAAVTLVTIQGVRDS